MKIYRLQLCEDEAQALLQGRPVSFDFNGYACELYMPRQFAEAFQALRNASSDMSISREIMGTPVADAGGSGEGLKARRKAGRPRVEVSREEARKAYREHKSQRKAAAALGISLGKLNELVNLENTKAARNIEKTWSYWGEDKQAPAGRPPEISEEDGTYTFRYKDGSAKRVTSDEYEGCLRALDTLPKEFTKKEFRDALDTPPWKSLLLIRLLKTHGTLGTRGSGPTFRYVKKEGPQVREAPTKPGQESATAIPLHSSPNIVREKTGWVIRYGGLRGNARRISNQEVEQGLAILRSLPKEFTKKELMAVASDISKWKWGLLISLFKFQGILITRGSGPGYRYVQCKGDDEAPVTQEEAGDSSGSGDEPRTWRGKIRDAMVFMEELEFLVRKGEVWLSTLGEREQNAYKFLEEYGLAVKRSEGYEGQMVYVPTAKAVEYVKQRPFSGPTVRGVRKWLQRIREKMGDEFIHGELPGELQNIVFLRRAQSRGLIEKCARGRGGKYGNVVNTWRITL